MLIMEPFACMVAVLAQSYSTSPNAGDRMQAMTLGRASFIVSVAGMIVSGAILFICLILVYLSNINIYSYR